MLDLLPRRYLIGQVGDSRAYLLRGGVLSQLTKDHSYVQEQVDAGRLTPDEARVHPYANVITRCVGSSSDVVPDLFVGTLEADDLVLLASDGLTGMLDDENVREIMMSGMQPGRDGRCADRGRQPSRRPRQRHDDPGAHRGGGRADGRNAGDAGLGSGATRQTHE